MLKKHKRKRIKPPRWTPLTIPQILEWADEYHRQTGSWPVVKSRNIGLPRGEKWNLLDNNLRLGQRDLPKGWSLAKVLAAYRGKRNSRDLPPLTIDQVLAWADAYHARTGEWPRHDSGPIPDSSVPDESWSTIEVSLVYGRRGLPAGSSVVKLLVEHRDQRNRSGLPRISEQEILRWAKAHYHKHGEWPSRASGPIESSWYPGDTWIRIDQNLRIGHRGLKGGSSLDQLLSKHVGKRSRRIIRPLTESQILAWADAFHHWHGKWPTQNSGNDSLPEGESWKLIQDYLLKGVRGLPGGSSLAKLLATHRKARNQRELPPLTEIEILAWADAWFRRTGSWPLGTMGDIPEAKATGDAWRHIDNALRAGLRGLPGGSSLAKLLAKHGRKRNRLDVPRLTEGEILAWADAWFQRTGSWPLKSSGAIPEGMPSGDTWLKVDGALRKGIRGLPGGSSLPRLLARHRRVRLNAMLPSLTQGEILIWADAWFQRTGRWPKLTSGKIPEAAETGDSWQHIDGALRKGLRGLPAGGSLSRLLEEHRGVARYPGRVRYYGFAP